MTNNNINTTNTTKAGKKRMIIGIVAIALVAVIAAGAMVFGAVNISKAFNPAPTTAISAKADTKALAAGKTAVTDQKGDKDNKLAPYYRLDIVNGDRVYTDIKNVAPKNSSNPYRYVVPTKCTDGFHWHGSADNDNVMIRCDFNETKSTYNFEICGLKPGTSHVELHYTTADGAESAANFNLVVDKDLSVFIA